ISKSSGTDGSKIVGRQPSIVDVNWRLLIPWQSTIANQTIGNYYCFLPKIGWPKSSVSRCRYLLFSWQIYSVSSPFGLQLIFQRTVNGLVYAPGSSNVAS